MFREAYQIRAAAADGSGLPAEGANLRYLLAGEVAHEKWPAIIRCLREPEPGFLKPIPIAVCSAVAPARSDSSILREVSSYPLRASLSSSSW